MCTGAEGLLIASLLSTAGGTVASADANRRKRHASQDAANFEQQKRAELTKQAEGLFSQELANSDPKLAGTTADTAGVAELAQAQQLVHRQDKGFVAPTDATPIGSPVVREVAARNLADELQRAESQMKARSVLQGLGLRQQQRDIQLGRTADRMNTINTFGQGWGRVGQAQQELAKYAGSDQAMLGDVLTGLGHIGTAFSGAAGGWEGLFGGGAATPASSAALSGAQLGDMPAAGALKLGETASPGWWGYNAPRFGTPAPYFGR